MSDLTMHEALAAALLRQCGSDARRLRRAIAEQEKHRSLFEQGEKKDGIDLIVRKLQQRLDQVEKPAERERGP